MCTVSIPCRSENSGGGGVRNEEKESSASAVSAVVRSERSVSILLVLLHVAVVVLLGVVSHLHGLMVTKTTTGKFSFRILAMSSEMAIHPCPTGNRWMNNRMTLFGCVDISDWRCFHMLQNSAMP